MCYQCMDESHRTRQSDSLSSPAFVVAVEAVAVLTIVHGLHLQSSSSSSSSSCSKLLSVATREVRLDRHTQGGLVGTALGLPSVSSSISFGSPAMALLSMPVHRLMPPAMLVCPARYTILSKAALAVTLLPVIGLMMSVTGQEKRSAPYCLAPEPGVAVVRHHHRFRTIIPGHMHALLHHCGSYW